MRTDPASGQSTEDAIVDYVSNSRESMTIDQVAEELERLARYGASWPKATRHEYKRAIERVIHADRLRVDGLGVLRLPEKDSAKTPMQQSLF